MYSLNDKEIKTLNLSSCNNGNIDWINSTKHGGVQFEQNLAITFLKTMQGIKEVKAWDGSASYMPIIGVEYASVSKKFNKNSLAKNGLLRLPNNLITYSRTNNGDVIFDKYYKVFIKNDGYYKTIMSEVIQ